ncbi:CHAT domain-containing protein, partial [Oscillochloris sp. ZM17-4]|uniref:CHAT domain-containing protein n=1 Tax=Oscillochloris sp. ZM17-4 TaxID=2866714 RepID=UPI001C72ADD8
MRDTEAVDLELALRPADAGYVADARLAQPGSQADAALAADVAVALDPTALLVHALDPVAYGHTLTEQLFADQRLRDAWQRARALADGADRSLRLRLRLAPTAVDLHALRWETLRDPLTQVPLACDARLRLVRYIDSPDTRSIRLGPKPSLRALLVVANPSDLATYKMAKIDVDGEVGRVRAALGDIVLTVIGDVEGAMNRRATLGAIQEALRAQPTILCLICHGQHTGDYTNLWLEDDEGKTAHTKGSVLSQMIMQLDRPPLLAVLI